MFSLYCYITSSSDLIDQHKIGVLTFTLTLIFLFLCLLSANSKGLEHFNLGQIFSGNPAIYISWFK